jgi:DNA (cytosine-5)-methyltransferase 1
MPVSVVAASLRDRRSNGSWREMSRPLAFYEFFAGGGMARLGLGRGWTCSFANDFDAAKAEVYRSNFGGEHLVQGDVWALEPSALPGRADLAWASSPCQDFSLAGGRAGLKGGRSGAFFGFWRLIEALAAEGRAPRAVVIENVTGLLTSHAGADFTALCAALAAQGYWFGALEIDAAAFLPQSRPRLFVIAVREPAPATLAGAGAFHTRAVRAAHDRLPAQLKERWLWWRAPEPPLRNLDLAALLEPDAAVAWHRPEQTGRLIELMSPAHRARLDALRSGPRRVAAVFRRMRTEKGRKVQRAEIRIDGLSGCLRTPRGGSSRQAILVVEGDEIRSRLLTGREAARLMGLPDDYRLPKAQTSALHVCGDGVAVPAVGWLTQHLLQPLLSGAPASLAAE